MTLPEPAESESGPRSSSDDKGGSPRSAPEASFTHHVSQDGPEIVVGGHEELSDGVGEESLEPMTRDELLASSSRSLALGALIGLALVAYFRFAYRSRWVDDFLQRNALGVEPRK